MKTVIALLVLVSLPLLMQAQVPCVQEYMGEMALYTNKGRLPQLPIVIDGNQGPLTDANGIFRYRLNKCPGMTVRIKLGSSSWDIVNHSEIYSYTIRQLADPTDFQFKLIVAQVQDIEKARRQYYANIAGVALDKGLTSMKGDIKKLTDLVVGQQRLIANGSKKPDAQTQQTTGALEQRLQQQQKEYQRALDSLVKAPTLLNSRIDELQKLLDKQKMADKHLIDSLDRGEGNQQSKIAELEKILERQQQENQHLLTKLTQQQDSTQQNEKTGELRKLVDQQKQENKQLLDSLSKKEMAWQKNWKDKLAIINTEKNKTIDQLRDSLARMQNRYKQALSERDNRLSEAQAMAAVFAKQTAIDSSYQQAFLKYKEGQFTGALSTLADDTLIKDKPKKSSQVGSGAPPTASGSSAEQSGSEAPKDRATYVSKYMLKANIYRSQYDMEQAAHWYEEAIRLDPTQVENILTYANFLQQFDRPNEPARWYQKALNLNPPAPLKANIYVELGYYHMANNRFGDAETTLQQAKTIMQQLARSDPEQNETGLARVLDGLGALYSKKSQYDEAEKALIQAKIIREKLVEKDADEFEADLAYTLVDVGNLYFETKRPREAKDEYLRAKDILNRLAATDGEQLTSLEIQVMHRLALLSAAQERRSYFLEADSLQQKVVELIEKHYGDGDPVLLARELNNWSYHSLFCGKFARAEELAEKALSYDEAEVDEVSVNANLAMAYLMQGKLADARSLYTYLKNKSRRTGRTRKTFLTDLDELEAAGLTHPDIAVIRKMLSQ